MNKFFLFLTFFFLAHSFLFSQIRTFVNDKQSISAYGGFYRGGGTSEVVNLQDEVSSELARSGIMYDFIRVGVNYSYEIKDGIILYSGAGFSNPQKTKTIHSADDFQRMNFVRRFVDIPIGIKWVYTKNWCKSYISGEYITQIYTNSTVDVEGEILRVNEDISRFHKAFNLGVGAEFRPWEKIGCFVQLNGLVQMSGNRGDNNYALGLGVTTGGKFYF